MSILMSPEDKALWNEVSESLIEAVNAFFDELKRKAEEAAAALEKIAALAEMNPEDARERAEELAKERSFWRGAAALARSRMAARAQAFARQMMQQKARQAMRRRKLKHADGSFPDWRCGCVR